MRQYRGDGGQYAGDGLRQGRILFYGSAWDGRYLPAGAREWQRQAAQARPRIELARRSTAGAEPVQSGRTVQDRSEMNPKLPAAAVREFKRQRGQWLRRLPAARRWPNGPAGVQAKRVRGSSFANVEIQTAEAKPSEGPAEVSQDAPHRPLPLPTSRRGRDGALSTLGLLTRAPAKCSTFPPARRRRSARSCRCAAPGPGAAAPASSPTIANRLDAAAGRRRAADTAWTSGRAPCQHSNQDR